MKIRSVAAELFHATDGRTVGHTNTTKLRVFFFFFAILQIHRKMSYPCRESNNTNLNTDVGCSTPNSAPPCWRNVWSMSLVLQHYVTAAERHRSLLPLETMVQLGFQHVC